MKMAGVSIASSFNNFDPNKSFETLVPSGKQKYFLEHKLSVLNKGAQFYQSAVNNDSHSLYSNVWVL